MSSTEFAAISAARGDSPSRVRLISAAIPFAVMAIGFLVLAGWQFGVSAFMTPFPRLVAMNPATAAAFVLAGFSLRALRGPESRGGSAAGPLAAIAAAFIGGIKAVGLLVGWDFGIDRILFGSRLWAAAPFPNRMAPNTAWAFLLAGVALFLLHSRRAVRFGQGLALVTALISITALVGYSYGLQALYGVSRYVPMALHTAFAFFLLSVGMLAARSREGLMRPLTAPGAGGSTARRLLPATVGTFLLLGWLRLEGQRRGLFPVEIGVALMVVSGIALLFLLIWWNARAMERAEAARDTAERALQKSERFLDSIIEQLPAMVFVKDAEHLRFVRFNRAGEELTGLSRGEILGKTDRDLFPPEKAEFFIAADREVLGGREAIDVPRETILTPRGERILHTRKIPLCDEEGNPRYLLGISSDITDRTKAQEEIQRFFDLSLDMLCIAGFDGYFKRLNPSWARTLGFTIPQMLEKPFIEFVHPDDRAATIEETTKLADGHETISFLNRYVSADGSYRWLLWNASSDPKADRIYAAARDVTDKRRSEEEIENLNRELGKRVEELSGLNDELEAFSYSVSHDLRAPLRHVTGFADLLQRNLAGGVDEKSRHFLGVISQSARRMEILIEDLLAFSRVGRVTMRSSRVDLRRLTEEVKRELEPAASGRDVEWRINRLPEVQGDRALLRQVLSNLLSNALKYTGPTPHAEIEVGCLPERADETVLFVRDNGVGFDMKYVDRLFGVFQRLHTADEFEGTGIGLANVRRIVHRHGGRTWAEGSPGHGATFFFSLPRASGSAA